MENGTTAIMGGGAGRAGRWAFVVLVVFTFLMTNRHQWAADVRDSADDTCYLAYAMSIGIDLDLDFANEVTEGRYLALNRRSPRGFYGAGLMAAPFVGAFSLIDRALGNPVIAERTQYLHSWSYFGFSVAVHVYFLGAFLLFWKVAEAIVRAPPAATIYLFVAGAGVLYFVLSRPRMSHAFELFALALAAYAAVGFWRKCSPGRPAVAWIALAAFAVNLTIAVRMNDAVVVALPVLIVLLLVLAERGDTGDGARLMPARALGLYAALGVVTFVPFAWLNVLIYDAALPTTADVFGPDPYLIHVDGLGGWLSLIGAWLAALPRLGSVVAGGEFGLVFTSPVIVFGIALVIPIVLGAARRRPAPAALALALVAGYVLFAASFVLFIGPGESYGLRYMIPVFPLAFVGYMLAWARARSVAGGAGWFHAVHAACILLSLFALAGQMLFTKTPALSYRTETRAEGMVTATAPDFVPNLAREIVAGRAWSVAFRDGVYGFVNKMYVNRTYLRWLWRELRGADAGPGPNRQHPPVVTLFMAILGLGWLLFFRRFRALAAALPPHPHSAVR